MRKAQGADADALALIRKHADSKEFFRGSYLHCYPTDKWKEPVAVMRELVQKHPKSRYAKYAAYLLAQYCQRGRGGTPLYRYSRSRV